MDEKGLVLQVQRFSVDDGPGVRSTVFLKGCTLRCQWCHNPESINPGPDIQFFADRCSGCGKCVAVCPAQAQQISEGQRFYVRNLCRKCGRCVESCPTGSLQAAGKRMSVMEIMAEVERDRPFYERSAGGVTFSGGEPLLQKDFILALLRESKARGLHTAVDTAGNVPWQNFAEILTFVDLFLYDIKMVSQVQHQQLTGMGNQIILDNLHRLAKTGTEIRVRVPVIPGVNDNRKEIDQIASLVEQLPEIRSTELLPYHALGIGKYASLGLNYRYKDCKPPNRDQMEELVEIFKQKGLVALYG